MHEHLLEDLPDEGECEAVFGDMVANLVDRLGNPAIDSWAQARIYGRSASADHRAHAALWLKLRHH
jgi:hypothetical protein